MTQLLFGYIAQKPSQGVLSFGSVVSASSLQADPHVILLD
jgi:hypothetical protein